MKNTVNYGLNMPDLDDFYNINDFNENAETIDRVMHENELAINSLSEETQSALNDVSGKIGNTDDTGATDSTGTVMGKLNALFNVGAVKSVQRGSVNMKSSKIDITISEVNPNKCFCYATMAYNSGTQDSYGNGVAVLSITATNLKLYAEHIGKYAYWQVVEFY